MPVDSSDSACGWMIRRRVYRDADAVAGALADALLAAFDRAASSGEPMAVMLAGGRTPKAAYARVAASGRVIPPSLTLMLSDDRWVPLDHPDSNYRMLRPFLDAVKAREEQLLMVNTALPRAEAARDFAQRLNGYFERGGRLASAFLGLGADGHTASLFNKEQLERATSHRAIDVDRPDGRIGISATPDIIRRASDIVFVVTGADKRSMAAQLLADPGSVIAGRVVWKHPSVALWLDEDAAGKPDSSTK